jgi:hypothetical protein
MRQRNDLEFSSFLDDIGDNYEEDMVSEPHTIGPGAY